MCDDYYTFSDFAVAILVEKEKCSTEKKITLIVCFSVGMYILFSMIMLSYFFLGDFSAEELW